MLTAAPFSLIGVLDVMLSLLDREVSFFSYRLPLSFLVVVIYRISCTGPCVLDPVLRTVDQHDFVFIPPCSCSASKFTLVHASSSHVMSNISSSPHAFGLSFTFFPPSTTLGWKFSTHRSLPLSPRSSETYASSRL